MGADPGTDLALLRLDEDPGLPVPARGDLSSLEVGNLVLAVARDPEDGLGASLGVLSALSGPWRTPRGGRVERFVQPDLALYPGFTGGPLVDVAGSLLGVSSAALLRGMAVALPVETVERVVAGLLERGGVPRSYLGLSMVGVRLPAGAGLPCGMIVLAVEPGGPAERAGALLGDVLLELDGRPTPDLEAILSILEEHLPPAQVEAVVLRAGRRERLVVELAERPRG